GKVVDRNGQPILGATVAVKGTTIGTISDDNGVYNLRIPNGSKSDTITVSFLGMQTAYMPVGNNSTIDVTLMEDDIAVEEVEITALGISKQRKAIGYAATKVDGDDIINAKTSNVIASVAGKVAGVEVMGNAGPGSTQNVMIRGAASLSGNQPLYIVDGVPIINTMSSGGDNLNNYTDLGSGLNAINPNDIESMTILKGAAATALYGSRATNGVVMITTKSGKNTNGKMIVTYDGAVSVQRVGYIPEVQEQFGQGWDGTFSREENGNWGPAYTNQNQAWGYIVDNSQQVAKYQFLKNRTREFYDLGLGNSHALSASGGNEKTSYYMSISNNHENGVIPGDHDTYNRTTISVKGSHTWNRLKFSSAFNYSNEKTVAVQAGQGHTMAKDLWDVPLHISLVDLGDLDNKFNQNSNYFTLFGINPYYLLENQNTELHRNKVYGKVQADIEIVKGLTLTYRFGGDIMNNKIEDKRNMVLFDVDSEQYKYNSKDDQTIGEPGYYSLSKYTGYEINNDAFLTYSKRLSDNWNLSAIAGMNVQEVSSNKLSGEINALVIPDFYNLTNSSSDPKTSSTLSKVRRVGAYANIDADFKSMLYLTFTMRNDWSSTLPTDNNSYAYPGMTAAWIFTELGNDGHFGPLTFGKVRASYGWTGKDATAYRVYDFYVSSVVRNPGYNGVNDLSFPIGGSQAWGICQIMGNPKIKPERTNEFEIGTELVFFNGRLDFDGAFYNKYTKNLIASLNVDNSTGYTSTLYNLGDISNKGYELSIGGTPVKLGDFSWRVSANFSQNFNKVEKLMLDEIGLEGFSSAMIYAVPGKAIGQFKTTPAATVTDPQGKVHTVVDAKGNPKTSTDMQYVGKDVNEKFRTGLTNRFEYKGFSLEATLDLHYGGYMYSKTREYLGWTGAGYYTNFNDRNPFVVPNSVVEV
ncbi:MAG: SusC/RagA family TonB-linked outer membrane protein, partial [Bacteroidales bacterium]|nr:SusC/RagA family TonB-linked outer membrane protein [Bacteroidales bacterium]